MSIVCVLESSQGQIELAMLGHKLHFIYLYMLDQFLPDVVMLLGPAIGRERAFCSHPDVVRTLSSPPTFFCSLSGT